MNNAIGNVSLRLEILFRRYILSLCGTDKRELLGFCQVLLRHLIVDCRSYFFVYTFSSCQDIQAPQVRMKTNKKSLRMQHQMNEVILPEWTAEDFFDRIGSYSWFMQCKVPLVRIHSIALRTICEEHGARKAKHQPLAFPELRVVEKSGSDLAKKVVYFLVAVHAFIEKLKSLLVSSRKEEFDNPLLLENLFIAEYGGLSTLEVILFDEEVVASLGETSLDILEYCYIKVC